MTGKHLGIGALSKSMIHTGRIAALVRYDTAGWIGDLDIKRATAFDMMLRLPDMAAWVIPFVDGRLISFRQMPCAGRDDMA